MCQIPFLLLHLPKNERYHTFPLNAENKNYPKYLVD